MNETGNKMITMNEGPGRVRASDRERERVASILRAAAAEGLLTMSEVDERLATAYAARYRDELDPLTADLRTAAARCTKVARRGPRSARSSAPGPAPG